MIEIIALMKNAEEFLLCHPHNYVEPQDAIREELVGMQIYEKSVYAVGDAYDPLFGTLQKEEVIHPDYKLPHDWNPKAKRIVSYFLPYTQQIKQANASDLGNPSDEWLHGRVEGQKMLNLLGEYIKDTLEKDGYSTVLPSTDPRFKLIEPYKSNWSERHTGFICGIGTFGLSKGIITEKGMAGRMGSVITSAEFPVSERRYTEIYEYCTKCGACERNCPAYAIDNSYGMHNAKDHEKCDPFLESTKKRFVRNGSEKTRYGCGKCQVKVPCENRIPNKKFRDS